MITGDSTRNPRLGFKKATILTSSSNLSISFTDLHCHFTFHSGSHDGRDAPKDHSLQQICAPLEMRDLPVAERLLRQRQTRVFLVSSVLDCLLTSLGPECLNWYGNMFWTDKVSAAFQNCVPNSRSPKGHSLWSFAPLFRSGHSCLIQPSHSQSRRTLSSQAPVFVGWFLSCGHTIRLQQSKTPFFAPIKSSLWSCTSSPGLKCVCSSRRRAITISLCPCRVSSFRHGRTDWQRIRPARLRWAQAPPRFCALS